MTRISRYKLKERVYEKMFQLLFEVMTSSREKHEFNKLLKDILSPTERIMIAKRVVLLYLLLQKIDYKTICNVLKVSSATVSKFNIIFENSRNAISVLERTLKHDRVKLFLISFINDLFPPGTYGINWTNAWKRKIRIETGKKEGIF